MVLMLLEGLSQARRSWQGGLWAMTVRNASVSAVPWREATEISSAPCRQGFKKPSAVRRMRLQLPQNRWLRGRIRPTVPA